MRSKLFPHQLRFDSSSARPWKIIAPSFCSFGFLIIKRVKKNKWLLFLLISDCSSHSIRKTKWRQNYFFSVLNEISDQDFCLNESESDDSIEIQLVSDFEASPDSFSVTSMQLIEKTTNWLIGWLLSERWLMGPRPAWKLTKMFFTNNKNVMEKNQF